MNMPVGAKINKNPRGQAQATRTDGERPLLADTLRAILGLDLKIEFRAEPHEPHARWVDAAALASPEHPHLAAMLARFKSAGYCANPRVAASVLMLRFGWVGGFAIAPYLARSRVPLLRDYGLLFPPSPGPGPRVLWIKAAGFVGRADDPLAGGVEWIESASEEVLRRRLLESLVAFTEPLVAALHAWSQRSRHALWAMATATWGAQFQAVARALGDEARGMREARAMYALMPEIARAAPSFHVAGRGGTRTYHQQWGSCCLYFKVSDRDFCASCPIIPARERRQQQQRGPIAQPLP
jgi:FhuF 2Fe-2S C-terminal domain